MAASAYAEEVARLRRQAGAELSGAKVGGLTAGVPGVDWIGAASNVLGTVLKPSSGGPSRSDANSGGYNTFDNSGFTVNTGSGTAASSRGIEPAWIMIAAGIGLIAWIAIRKK